jgi:hypothetical protein
MWADLVGYAPEELRLAGGITTRLDENGKEGPYLRLEYQFSKSELEGSLRALSMMFDEAVAASGAVLHGGI